MIATHTIRNGEIIASNEIWESMDLINTDDNSRVNLQNIYFNEIRNGQIINRITHNEGQVTFSNILLNVAEDSLISHVGETTTISYLQEIGIQTGVISPVNKNVLNWAWALN
jgi:hypothetical protein